MVTGLVSLFRLFHPLQALPLPNRWGNPLWLFGNPYTGLRLPVLLSFSILELADEKGCVNIEAFCHVNWIRKFMDFGGRVRIVGNHYMDRILVLRIVQPSRLCLLNY